MSTEQEVVGNCNVGVVVNGKEMYCANRRFAYGEDPGNIKIGRHGVNKGSYCNMVYVCLNSKGCRFAHLKTEEDLAKLRTAVIRLSDAFL